MIKNSVKILVSFLILVALCFSCASSASTVKTMDGDSLVARNSGREKLRCKRIPVHIGKIAHTL